MGRSCKRTEVEHKEGEFRGEDRGDVDNLSGIIELEDRNLSS